MKLRDARRHLTVVGDLPQPDSRRLRAQSDPSAPRPRYAIWEITLACDQRCIHCGSRAGKARKGELSTVECLDVVNQLADLGVGEVTLIGGEAYLRNDFVLIINAIRKHGMSVTMTTGGLHLNDERVAAMKDAGIRAVAISIDGLASAHDFLRGVPGSYERALAAMRRLRAHGVPCSVNSQINRRTLHDLPDLLETIAPLGAIGWQLQITSPFGNAADHPEILLQPYMMPEVFETLERVMDRARQLRVPIFPGNNLGYFGPLESRLRATQKKHYKGCVAGRHQIGLEAHGDVKGCPSLGGRENVGGNVREHSLREIWTRSREISYIRERTTNELWGYCARCYYADVCRGGCTATAEPLLGRPGNNPYCHHRALELAREGLRERIEQVKPGGGIPFDHGLYRLICEPSDPKQRAALGAVHIEEPRTSRVACPMGPGAPV